MFSKLKSLVISQSFKTCFLMGLCVHLLALTLVGLNTTLTFKNMLAKERQQIIEARDWIIEIYKEDGARALIRELSEDDPAIWSEERLEEAAFENGLVWQIRNKKNQVVLGTEALAANEGWSVLRLKELGIHDPLDVYSVKSRNDYKLTIGKFRHPSLIIFQKSRRNLLFLWGLGMLPLSLLFALVIANRQKKRILSLCQTSDAIAAGELETRLEVTRKKDEIDTLANSVNTMVDHLKSLQRNIDSVSIGIAHDLKTPVTQLDGRLQLIEQDLNHPAAVEQHIQAARQHIVKILDTFQALLRLGEIEAGQRHKHFRSCNLSTLLRDVAESYQPVFEDAGKSIDISIVDDITINGDSDLIIQMVINLLENSIQHSNTNAKAWLRLQMSRDGVVLQIGDNGPGIPAEDTARIFERFYRVDKSRSKSSNGLGLSLVKSICDLHGAQIHLLPGQKGAVFDIYFSVNFKRN